MTDFEFIKSISNVPKKPLESTVRSDAFGHHTTKVSAKVRGAALATQPSPPWEQEPDTPRDSIGWVMGSGAEYRQQFKSWFTGLDSSARDDFMRAHPEPEGWRGFYGDLISGA